MQAKLDKYEELRKEFTALEKSRDAAVAILENAQADPLTIELVASAYSKRITVLKNQLENVKKSLGMRTVEQEKLAKKVMDFKMSKLPNYVKDAEWGTMGKDGAGPMKFVRLIDCSSEHLGLILCQLDFSHRYRNDIQQILTARQQ